MVITTEFSVFPNPFDHFIIVEVSCPEDIDCIVLLTSLEEERIVRMLGAGLKGGFNRIPLYELQSLATGHYQLDIKTPAGDTIYQTVLIKQGMSPLSLN